MDDPRSALEAAFAALAARDWPALVRHIDAEALAMLRVSELGSMIFAAEQRMAGNTRGGGYEPEELVSAEHLSRVGGERVTAFLGEPTIAELAVLAPTDFFRSWCAAAFGSTPSTRSVRQVVAAVREGDDLAHVLYRRERFTFGESNRDLVALRPGSLEIMAVRRHGTTWRLLLNLDVAQRGPSYMWPELKKTRHSSGTVQAIQADPPLLPAVAPFGVDADRQLVDTMVQAGAALSRGDWNTLAGEVDPDALAEFQRDQLNRSVQWEITRPLLKELSTQNPVVVNIVGTLSGGTGSLVERHGTTIIKFGTESRTIHDLASLTPLEFFTAWCEAANGPGSGAYSAARMAETRTIIGAATEGARRGHVLYRPSGTVYDRPWDLERMEMIWSGERWGMKLNDDIGSGWDLRMGGMM